ncbi:MAG TPA: universal stress protein [Alcanivoracaceae bacterium]|nr:universal stress protein [Alcanivoracaceae bacterium]
MFNRILVAIDEKGINYKILNAVLGIANYKNAQLSLVHVNQTTVTAAFPYVSRDLMQTTIDEMEAASEKLLDEAEEALVEDAKIDLDVKKVHLRGDPATQLLDYAEEENIDLIIIGSRGLDGVKGLLLGSVSYKVSQAAPCSVMIVH